MIQKDNILEYAHLIIKLLQGVIYDDDQKIWNDLYNFQSKLKQYFAQIGIEFYFDAQNGFAYISQPDYEGADSEISVPRLVKRIPLSYEVTMLLVVLREILDEFDSNDLVNKKCFITRKELREKAQTFFKDKTNKTKLLQEIGTHINKCADLGFLKLISEGTKKDSDGKDGATDDEFEIKRIVKAKISVEKLEQIKTKLNEIVNYANNSNGNA